jgi:hypothetical protein
MNCHAPAFARQSRQKEGAAQYHDGIIARYIKRNEFTARRRHIGDKTTCARRHNGMMTSFRQDPHQFDRPGIGGAAIERRHDNEYSDWSVCSGDGVRNDVRVSAICRQSGRGQTRHRLVLEIPAPFERMRAV